MNLSEKSETNLTVDLVGLSDLLKLCLTESVSELDKLDKPESLLKIYYLVVKDFSLVDKDVTEDIPKELGLIS